MTGTTSVNIAAHLPKRARTRPYALAVVCPAGVDRGFRPTHTHWTFAQLDRECDLMADGLVAHGIDRGMRTALMVKPSLEFFALTFALFKIGAVPVLIDPGMGLRNLGKCLAEAEPAAFLGIPAAQRARRLLGWARSSVRLALTIEPGAPAVLNDPDPEHPEPFPVAETRGDETAAILFTSGSTGVPKGAVYTHSIFDEQVKVLRDLYGIEPGEVDLCTFPLFALFGPALGMTAIVPEMDFTRPARVSPAMIFQNIEDFGVTNLFGSPALLRRVGHFGALGGRRCPTLRRVISAGAPVPATVLETFATMLEPGVPIHTPYGATEALPVASIDSGTILGETRHATDIGAGVCVGRPVGVVRVQIIRIDDGPIAEWSDDLTVPDGTIGEITVRGPVVTREYFQRPMADALAKIAGPGPGEFWHRMGDVGYRDERGRIWFCGRKTHRVITSDGTLFTIPCEAIFNTHPAVYRTALVGVGPPGAARPVLCVELLPSRGRLMSRDQIRRDLLESGARFPHTKAITAILFHPSFPVDIRHNAKIFREKLAAWASRRVR